MSHGFFLLDIFFIYISNAIPFPSFLSISPLYPLSALLPNPPTPASWPWHSPVLGHIIFARLRASSTINGKLGHALLHMQLETSSGRYWLVHIVVPPIGLQIPLAPWALYVAPPFHPIDDCEHSLLYLPGTGIASQETAISGSCQQNLAGICNSVWV